MPSLGRTLQDFDLGHLRIVAELWGLDLPTGRPAEAGPKLARLMLEPGLALEIAQGMPARSTEALSDLLQHDGRQSMAELSLRFGPMTAVGPGRRDRERPWRDPEAALDGLWYRGFVGMAFFDTPSGPQEFAFLPDELHEALRPLAPSNAFHLPPVSPPTIIHPAGGAADDAVTILAALRRRSGRSGDASRGAWIPPARAAALQRHLIHPDSLSLLLGLLRGIGVLVLDPVRPDPAKVKRLLASPRGEVESHLRKEWQSTRAYNDLAHAPGLAAPKGRWPNDPASTREALLALVSAWQVGEWFTLEAMVGAVRQRQPAFLRPAGDFDSWLLQEAVSGRWLRGLADWEMVEGNLLRYVIAGPLHWLGVVDLGTEDPARQPTHFRLRLPPSGVSQPANPPETEIRDSPARVFADGRVVVPRGAPLAHRYQVARFAEWAGRDASGYRYRVTPRALAAAASQGLDARRVEGVLEVAARRSAPETLQRAIERWSVGGEEAALESTLVLRVKRPEILRQLRGDPATARFLEQILGPTAARVRSRNREALLAAAARRGLLIQPPEE